MPPSHADVNAHLTVAGLVATSLVLAFVLLPTDAKDPAQSQAVLKLFDWSFANGAKIATDLLYVPLPQAVQNAIRASWKTQNKG